MNNLNDENTLKTLLNELAGTVADLPTDLRATAFATLLKHRLQKPTNTQSPFNTVGTAPTANSQSIGEFLASFKADLREDEKLLAAIAFTQAGSEENCSTVEAAHTNLKDIGIKLSNAGVFGKQLLKKKMVFATGKSGKSMKLRVSADGSAALQKLQTLAPIE